MRGDFTEWQLSRASEIPQFKLNSHNGSLRSEIRNSEQRRLAIVRLWDGRKVTQTKKYTAIIWMEFVETLTVKPTTYREKTGIFM